MQLQFRVGDGQTISTYWQALCHLNSFALPYVAPWNRSSPDAYDRAFSAHYRSTDPYPSGVQAFIDTDAVGEYYRDLASEGGVLAFMESHFGKDKADKWCQDRRQAHDNEKELLKRFSDITGGRGIEDFAEHCRRAGHVSSLELLEEMREAAVL